MRFAFLLVLLTGAVSLAAQDPAPPRTIDLLYGSYDELLNLHVRDGFVYYNALKSDRGRLDRFVADLGAASLTARSSPAQQKAFWLNAYHAFVLRTIVDHYPIRGRSPDYPTASIRQIPGAFDKRPHRAGGRTVTLDAIEKEILAPMNDARVFLALNRGSIGGARLRAEAFDASRLDAQLDAAAAEAVGRRELIRVEASANQLSLSPLFSWREAAFAASHADKAPEIFSQRSPLERAVLALADPHLLGAEAEFLRRNEFRTVFHEFNWRLNDLSSRDGEQGFKE
jgi:hypothetical protein